MSAAELRQRFWVGLAKRLQDNRHWGLDQFRHVHGNDAYIEFNEDLGAGFRPRAVYLVTGNELRSEILTTSRGGMAFLDHLLAKGSQLPTLHGSIAEVPSRKNARMERCKLSGRMR